jgi:TonB-dependent SusC/RagA subfamily outer membrane receptor
LRYAFGSRLAYLIWLLVPMAMVGVVGGSFVPVKAFAPNALSVQISGIHLPWPPTLAAPSSSKHINWIVIGWMFGAMLFALMQSWQQYSFVRRLGVLRKISNGAWISESMDIGPAVVGVFPPRMVLPTDFFQRFSAPEQTFVLAHESMHILRRDPLANFVVVVVRSLVWFHPLVHLAIRYFRIDQELACDADVLSMHSQGRHHYASAILKSRIGIPALPAGCHLDSYTTASLKWRFRMLLTPLPSRKRQILGAITIGLSVITGGGMACAANTDATNVTSVSQAPELTLRRTPEGVKLLATSTPVFVDGVRIYSENQNATPLDDIAPQNIQTIEVLRGPSAVARYGSDAQNGVILITTKRRQP